MECGKLGEELAERPGVDRKDPLDPGQVTGSPPALPTPVLDRMLWFWPERQYAMDYADMLYPGE
jgi:hypothetical protein